MTAPHPPLHRFYAREEEREIFVRALFDRAAPHYDRINTALAFGSGLRYRRQALRRVGLRPGMTVLDVAMGTGLVARAAVEILGDARAVIGLDPSEGMLREGRRTLAVRAVQGVGERLPFVDGCFDLVTMGYALRHVLELERAFAEYRRVLKPGGRVLLLEITRPASPLVLRLLRWYMEGVVPRLTRLLTRSEDAERLTRYYWETIAECVPPATILDALSAAGFGNVRRRTFGGLLSEYQAVRG
jgi:demethylmenaquinone methyltransferase/2-methoxy-6-polyprenyl-1,4-benzoquinol methylase